MQGHSEAQLFGTGIAGGAVTQAPTPASDRIAGAVQAAFDRGNRAIEATQGIGAALDTLHHIGNKATPQELPGRPENNTIGGNGRGR